MGVKNSLSVRELQNVREYLISNVMRNDDIMLNAELRDNVDLPSIIASLYELLHREVTGVPYEYMFHWANKVGSDVEDDIFKEVLDEVPED